MAKTGSTRTRVTLVAGAAALAVVTATASVSAHEGGATEGTIHACATAATGALRVLSDPAQECRRNETPLHWTVGGGSSEELDAFKAQLAAAAGGDLVHWDNLHAVPADLADGQVTAAEVFGAGSSLSDGTVSLLEIVGLPDWLSDGIVHGSDVVGPLPASSVTGATIADGSITAHDLAGSYGPQFVSGAVTGEKIADGTVEPRDLRPAVASTSTGATQVALSSTAIPVGAAPVTAQAGDLVMVSGQAQLTLTGPCGGCTDVVSYQVVRDGVPVGPLYRTQLSDSHAVDVAGIGFLDTVPTGGTHQYALRLSTTGSSPGISASELVLTAQVLGPN